LEYRYRCPIEYRQLGKYRWKFFWKFRYRFQRKKSVSLNSLLHIIHLMLNV